MLLHWLPTSIALDAFPNLKEEKTKFSYGKKRRYILLDSTWISL